jgi:hypothetical protein
VNLRAAARERWRPNDRTVGKEVAHQGRARLNGEAPDVEFRVVADDEHQRDGETEEQGIAEQVALEGGRADTTLQSLLPRRRAVTPCADGSARVACSQEHV